MSDLSAFLMDPKGVKSERLARLMCVKEKKLKSRHVTRFLRNHYFVELFIKITQNFRNLRYFTKSFKFQIL